MIAEAVGIDGWPRWWVLGSVFATGVQILSRLHVVAHTHDGLWLLRAKPFSSKPSEVLGAIDPRSVSIRPAFLNRKVTIAGQEYTLVRMAESRLRVLLKPLDAAAPQVPPGYTPYAG